jgi:outer membrane protein TolC
MTRITIVVLASVLVATTDGRSAFAQASTLRLTVAEAIARGVEASHRLAEIRAREQGAQASVQVARVSDRPLVAASAGYMRTNHVPEFSLTQGGLTRVLYPDIPDNVVSRVSFQWPIYTAGRVDAMERAALAEAQAVGVDLVTARADLRLEIVRAYWAAVTSREAVRVLEESMARIEAQLRDARERFAVGLIPPSEISSLSAQRSREEAQRIEARNIHASTLVDLRRLIGADADAALELTDALDAPQTFPQLADSATVSDTVRQAIDQRPERRALTFRLDGARARELAAASGSKPAIVFGGGVDYANPNPRIFPRQGAWQDSWDLSINVSWTLLDFGRTKAQLSEAAAAVAVTRERLAEFDSLVAADVRQRLLDLDSSRALLRAAADAVTSAAEARRVVADRFTAGVATSTDVLVAQAALLETELVRTRALAGVRLAEARLERSMGRP